MLTGMFTAGGGIDTNLEVGVEKAVGTITINGTTYTRYVKIVDCGALPNATGKQVSHGITYTGVEAIYGTAINTSNLTSIPLPYTSPSNAIGIYITSSIIQINTVSDLRTYNKSYVTIEYYR